MEQARSLTPRPRPFLPPFLIYFSSRLGQCIHSCPQAFCAAKEDTFSSDPSASTSRVLGSSVLCYHTWFMKCWACNPRLDAGWVISLLAGLHTQPRTFFYFSIDFSSMSSFLEQNTEDEVTVMR